MANTFIIKAFCVITAFGAATLFTGCARDSADSAFASFASQEVSNMGADAGSVMATTGAAKMSIAATETTIINYTYHPYHYDSIGRCFVRVDSLTTSEGYERIRIDTITFFDNGENKLAVPRLGTVAHFTHVRNATHTRGGNEADIHFSMYTVMNYVGDTSMTKNGSLSGTYNGDAVATGSVTNVTRFRMHNLWQFPESGNIVVDFPNWKYEVVFTGNGNATADITNKKKDKVTEVNIHVDER